MSRQVGNLAAPPTDNDGFPAAVSMQREPIDVGALFAGAMPTAEGLSALLEEEDDGHNDESQISVPALETQPNQQPPSTPQQPIPTATAAKARKNPTRAKQYLLPDKTLFLKPSCAEEFTGDNNMLLQGFVLECPNKKLNDGKCRTDWERNTSLPPDVMPPMLQTWFASTKQFRDSLDTAIQRWHDQASDEQKARCQRKRKIPASTEASNPLRTPPPHQLNFEARAGL